MIARGLLTSLVLVTISLAVATLLARTGLYSTYIVLSGSMEPLLPTGSLAIALPTPPAEIAIGDVVSVTSQEPPYITITHRVVGIRRDQDKLSFQTRGDANEANDPWETQYTGLAGRVMVGIPLAGYVLSAFSDLWVRWTLGAVLMAGVLASAVAAFRPAPAPTPVAPGRIAARLAGGPYRREAVWLLGAFFVYVFARAWFVPPAGRSATVESM